MSRRNVFLLISIITVIAIMAIGFAYLYQSKNQQDGSGEGTNFFSNFLPFGNSGTVKPGDTTSPTDISGYIPPGGTEIPDIKLKKVSSFPVAGYGVFVKEVYRDVPNPDPSISSLSESGNDTEFTAPPTEFVLFLRYVDRVTGNIYQTLVDKIDERKFSSTIIPKVYDASFGNKGESVVMRYLKEDNKTIETFVGNLPKEYLGADGGVNEVKGFFLPENIIDVGISPDTSKMFYLFNTNDTVAGVVLTLATNAKSQVFDSPFTEWLSLWPNEKMITITTKPSASVPGYMYAINPDKKDLNKILGGINGLTTLTSPDGKMILYGNNNLSLNIFNTDTRDSGTLSVKTLPEKCVWARADVVYCAVPKYIYPGTYPDLWYQGEVSFSDEIWRIDVEDRNATMILDIMSSPGGEEIDAIKLDMDENQDYLFFVNKKDSYLWEFKLK